jgi:hypothetical protein
LQPANDAATASNPMRSRMSRVVARGTEKHHRARCSGLDAFPYRVQVTIR